MSFRSDASKIDLWTGVDAVFLPYAFVSIGLTGLFSKRTFNIIIRRPNNMSEMDRP